MRYLSAPRRHGRIQLARACVLGLLLWGCSSSPDDGATYSCKTPPANRAACAIDADCATVTLGCYCGAQPVDGVAATYAASAQACEDAAAGACTLGCLIEAQLVTQDGKKADVSATVAVRCDHPGGAAGGTCTSFLP